MERIVESRARLALDNGTVTAGSFVKNDKAACLVYRRKD